MVLVKVEAVGYPETAFKWDHAGRTNIVQIIVSHSSDRLYSLHFTYLLDNGSFHTSDIVGSPNFAGGMLNAITFKGGGEYVTKVEGEYTNRYDGRNITKLSIHTNIEVYNVFEAEGLPANVIAACKKFSFNFGELKQFGGFYGSRNSSGEISSIGVYFNLLEGVPPKYKTSARGVPSSNMKMELVHYKE